MLRLDADLDVSHCNQGYTLSEHYRYTELRFKTITVIVFQIHNPLPARLCDSADIILTLLIDLFIFNLSSCFMPRCVVLTVGLLTMTDFWQWRIKGVESFVCF